jgi:phosphopantothenoylcysteine decarboxylase/phosphopantothenate--cysteine ligase
MSEPEEIFDAARFVSGRKGDFAGRRVVITAGGTREPLDPIRYLGNRSSGRMGYSVAAAARDRGAEVTLITTMDGPALFGAELKKVETAAEMHREVMTSLTRADVLVMAAAVADYRPASVAKEKIKKNNDGLHVEMERTTDILSRVAGDRRAEQVVVGFAAETGNLVENAREKLKRKKLDLIVANDAVEAMGASGSEVTLIHADDTVENLPHISKSEIAIEILDRVKKIVCSRSSKSAE